MLNLIQMIKEKVKKLCKHDVCHSMKKGRNYRSIDEVLMRFERSLRKGINILDDPENFLSIKKEVKKKAK